MTESRKRAIREKLAAKAARPAQRPTRGRSSPISESRKDAILARIAEKKAASSRKSAPTSRMSEAQRARKIREIKARLAEKRNSPTRKGGAPKARMTEAQRARKIREIKARLAEKRNGSRSSSRMTEAKRARRIREIKARLAEKRNTSTRPSRRRVSESRVDTRAARVSRIKESILRASKTSSRLSQKSESKARIEAIKARLAEKYSRASKTDTASLVRQAEATQRRIKGILQRIKEADALAPQQDPNMMVQDPNMAAPEAAPIPTEIANALVTISGELDNVLTQLGMNPAADAGMEAVDPNAAPALEDPNASASQIMEALRARRGKKQSSDLVESTRAKVQARREALQKLRANSLQEGEYDGCEPPAGSCDPNTATAITPPSKTALKNNAATQKARQPKAATRWEPKNLTTGKFKDGKGFGEATDSTDLLDAQIDKYIEKRQLNFKELVAKGMLG